MASQVLSGVSNPTYTNNTGGNVRVVINYMSNPNGMTWAGVTTPPFGGIILAIGRNLAFSAGVSAASNSLALALSSNNMVMDGQSSTDSELINAALPTEIMLAPGQVFSATCGTYNIVVIPEAG